MLRQGYGRFSFKENIQFCRIGRASLNEVLDQLYVALDEKYITQDCFNNLYKEGRNTEYDINGYIGFLKKQT
jgi:four helix bundle protein